MTPFPPERAAVGEQTPPTRPQDTREAWSASERHALACLMAPRPFERLGTPSDTWWDRLDRMVAERHADAVLAAGYVRAESVASELEDRAWERDQDETADAGPQCPGDCDNADCHRIAAVATWQRAAIMVRNGRGSVSGGGNATK